MSPTDRSGTMIPPLDATSRDRVERTPQRVDPSKGRPTPETAATERLSFVLNLTLTPHHSITVTTSRSLSSDDRKAIHDWHQRSHDEANIDAEPTRHRNVNQAGFPSAERRDPA